MSGAQSGAQSGGSAEEGPTVIRDSKEELPEVTFSEEGVPSMKPSGEKPPSNITVQVLKAAEDGQEVTPNDIVTVHYSTFLWDSSREIDGNFSGDTSTFALSEVVPAWKWGLSGVRVGETVELIAPPEFAYGSAGSDGIPADSTLVFVIEVAGIQTVDPEILKEATPIDAQLPAGIELTGELGSEPIIGFERSVKPPKEAMVVPLSEGTGAVVTDADSVLFHVAMAPWGSAGSQQSTWGSDFQQVAQALPSMLGQRVGSRILVVEPATAESSSPAVYVVDVVGAYAK